MVLVEIQKIIQIVKFPLVALDVADNESIISC